MTSFSLTVTSPGFAPPSGTATGSLLDAGCGTGDTALYFAGRGCQVTGVDFIEEAIQRARRKSTDQGVPATFLVLHRLTLHIGRTIRRPLICWSETPVRPR